MVTADKWGKSTRIDPFTDIYDVGFFDMHMVILILC